MRSAVLQNTAATHATNMSSRPRLDYDEHDNFVEQHKRANPAHSKRQRSSSMPEADEQRDGPTYMSGGARRGKGSP